MRRDFVHVRSARACLSPLATASPSRTADSNRPNHASAQPDRAYLDVPYADKDAAKAAGARWDLTARRWYDPRDTTPPLQRWAARPEVPEVPGPAGRDRSSAPACSSTSCPDPAGSRTSAVASPNRTGNGSAAPPSAGSDTGARPAARPKTARPADGSKHTNAGTTTTTPACNHSAVSSRSARPATTHFGYANVTGRTSQALAHLRTVTGMTDREAWAHVDAAQHLWIARSKRTWELDLTILTGAGITLARPEPGTSRAATAERSLRREQANDPRGRLS